MISIAFLLTGLPGFDLDWIVRQQHTGVENENMRFEWDEQKNRENIRRHGIDFCDVPGMFQYYVLIDIDDRHNYGEDRWIGIGMLRNILVVVVFTERDNNTIRIISARQANKYERQKYQHTLPNELGTIRTNER